MHQPSLSSPLSATVSDSAAPRLARWRHLVALLILSAMPLLAAFASTRRVAKEGFLPSSSLGLLLFCAWELGAFAAIWGVAWAFSRLSREQLFLPWRAGWKPLAWGVAYSLGLRLGLVMVATLVLLFLSLLGFSPQQLTAGWQENAQGAQKAFAPLLQGGDTLYKTLMITLVSFVVAGGREEIWRAALMASLGQVAPARWTTGAKIALALLFSSALFGVGHWYQGALGVVGTSLLGVALGAITLRHRSVWPTIIAHGCFDALSFLGLALAPHAIK